MMSLRMKLCDSQLVLKAQKALSEKEKEREMWLISLSMHLSYHLLEEEGCKEAKLVQIFKGGARLPAFRSWL